MFSSRGVTYCFIQSPLQLYGYQPLNPVNGSKWVVSLSSVQTGYSLVHLPMFRLPNTTSSVHTEAIHRQAGELYFYASVPVPVKWLIRQAVCSIRSFGTLIIPVK